MFSNPRNVPVSLEVEDQLHRFGLTMGKVAIELFRLNGGRAGYYLANLREKKYYYCGDSLDEVRAVFVMLGIGKADPQESDCS